MTTQTTNEIKQTEATATDKPKRNKATTTNKSKAKKTTATNKPNTNRRNGKTHRSLREVNLLAKHYTALENIADVNGLSVTDYIEKLLTEHALTIIKAGVEQTRNSN